MKMNAGLWQDEPVQTTNRQPERSEVEAALKRTSPRAAASSRRVTPCDTRTAPRRPPPFHPFASAQSIPDNPPELPPEGVAVYPQNTSPDCSLVDFGSRWHPSSFSVGHEGGIGIAIPIVIGE